MRSRQRQRQRARTLLLISGPVSQLAPPGVELHYVTTAEEMFETTHALISRADIFIAAAAVADYRPAEVKSQKIKKNAEKVSIELVRCPDILASVAALPAPPFTVGFAAETEKVDEHARAKLESKKLDMIVANQVGDNLAFDSDDNAVSVLWQGNRKDFPTAAKTDLARDLIALIAERFLAGRSASGGTTPERHRQ